MSLPFQTLQLPGFPEELAVPGVSVASSGVFGWCFWGELSLSELLGAVKGLQGCILQLLLVLPVALLSLWVSLGAKVL